MPIEFHRDGPWDLPEGWVWVRLGQLGRWTGGGTPSKANAAFWANGTIPWVSPKDMKVDVIADTEDFITPDAVANSATKVVTENSILMVVRSGILKHTFPVALTDRDVTINQDMRALSPLDGIDARYLTFVLRRLQRQILDECSKDGTTVASVEPVLLEQVWVPIPPAAEQRRIVARIDELFTEIADGETMLTRARDNLDTWRSALLKAAVTGELTREWREHNKSNVTGHDLVAEAALLKEKFGTRRRGPQMDAEIDMADLPNLPEGWTWAKLSDFSRASSYGTSVKCSQDARGVAVLRIPNVRANRIDTNNLKWATVDLDIDEDDLLSCGDLLIVRTNGSEDLIGRAAIVDAPLEDPTYFASYLIRFRIVDSPAVRRWIGIFFETPVARTWIRKNIASSAGQYNISQSALMRMPIPVPPEPEIAAALTAFTEMESIRMDAAADTLIAEETAPALHQSILKAAFEGHLVQQDPREERADVLLARLSGATDQFAPAYNRRARRARSPATGAEV
jgi:type I restriction enzyme S subunit